MKKIFRDNGAIGALLDEYEKAVNELVDVIRPVSNQHLIQVVDKKTSDKDCRSIQTILSHVVESGYTYVIEIRKWLGETITYKKKETFQSTEEYAEALQKMFEFNEKLFVDHPKIKLVEKNPTKKVHVRWRQKYDVDQLIEHAIVHILRHRRQIERFKLKLEKE